MSRRWFRIDVLARRCLFATIIPLMGPSAGRTEVLLRDDFDGSGPIDTSVWRIPFGEDGTFLGRTQLRLNPSTDIPQKSGGVTRLQLDTYSPLDPGNHFLGSEMLTKRNFARGGGLAFESRLRLVDPVGGLVAGFFAYDVQRDVPPGSANFVRDEMDYELLSNQVVSGTHDVATNFWNDGSFVGPGSGGDLQFHDRPGLDLSEFHVYRVEWRSDSIRWLVDGVLVRTETSDVPDDPMKVRANLWVPDDGFSAAFDASLVPAATEGANQTFTVEIEYIEVERFSTAVGSNLLADPSFDDMATPAPDGTSGWTLFHNAFIEDALADPSLPVVSGTRMLKAFGPSVGSPEASGAYQNVSAAPGQQFEARVFAQSSTTANGGLDPINGTDNFSLLSISFVDSSGEVLKEFFGGTIDPDNLVDTNGKNFPLLDGRDPNLVEDHFVLGAVNAVAPEGTAYARLSLFFVQLANQGGAVYFDDAFFGVIAEATMGDLDCDGDVDFDDIDEFVLGLNDPALYESNFGLAPAVKGDTDSDGDLDFDDIAGFVALLFAGDNPTGQAVPEPAALALAASGGMLLLSIGPVAWRTRRLGTKMWSADRSHRGPGGYSDACHCAERTCDGGALVFFRRPRDDG
jgi:hypothetical protein